LSELISFEILLLLFVLLIRSCLSI